MFLVGVFGISVQKARGYALALESQGLGHLISISAMRGLEAAESSSSSLEGTLRDKAGMATADIMKIVKVLKKTTEGV